jgi:chemotaxis protein methyltransferase CheR
MPEPIDALEVRLFLDAIQERYGYDFRDYSSSSIQRRVRAALAKSEAANLGDLQHRVLVEPAVFAAVLDTLTLQVTDLFRDSRFYMAFRQNVVPVLRTYPQVKIWHAGCATGEEVYSMAILLADEGLYERCQIYATDISVSAVEQARDGVYSESRLAAFAQSYLTAGGTGNFEKYYVKAYRNLIFNESLRRNMMFFQQDLVSDDAPGQMHVILCRNVMIYFNSELRTKVVNKLASALYRGGFLCLGKDEGLPVGAQPTHLEQLARERIYRWEVT